MESITVREVRLRFPKILRKRTPLLVTRIGKPIAALIPLTTDADVEDFILANSPRIGQLLKAAERDLAHGRTISLQDYLAKRRSR